MAGPSFVERVGERIVRNWKRTDEKEYDKRLLISGLTGMGFFIIPMLELVVNRSMTTFPVALGGIPAITNMMVNAERGRKLKDVAIRKAVEEETVAVGDPELVGRVLIAAQRVAEDHGVDVGRVVQLMSEKIVAKQ